MSKIKNGGLDQYDAEPFEQHQHGTAGVEGVKVRFSLTSFSLTLLFFGIHDVLQLFLCEMRDCLQVKDTHFRKFLTQKHKVHQA